MALQQPGFLALKSETNNRYLRYIHQDIEGVHGILQFSGEEVLSPYAKFQVEVEEPATINNNNRRLVHIRSCYNNKYWRRADQNSRWIVAGADERKADQNLWSCTLFEPIKNDIDSSQIRLRHVHSGHYLKISPTNECLFISQNFDVFTVIDWNALVIFPKYLAFKVDVNGVGNYLRVQTIDTHPYLQFSATDPTERQKENKVVTAGDGSVRIMSTFTKKFWRRNSSRDDNISNNWIWADSDDTNNRDSNTLFRPVKVEANPGDVNVVVALRNLGNNNFCNTNNDVSCLTADSPNTTPGPDAHLIVEELVMSRTISDLNFRLADARIYNREIDQNMAEVEYENPSAEVPASKTLKLFYEDERTSTWNTSADDVSFTAFIQTTLTSDTPFVVQDEGVRIRVSGNFDGAYQWGQHLKSKTQIERRFPVVVPPRHKVTVKLLATKASCDIPFSYSQRDTLISQTPAIITCLKEGGLYSGKSLYNFYHTTETEPLP
ncbi:uncharacterized protein LOC117629171 [Prunus dulcis]|uniref:uncharacterized protein LOC117629171 n=1 Tax=Prunus dulcis TaxID=3755 RepID=UPI00148377EF|nr:uncharacterized protein LOC117629171 [Prunus dulcis]